MKTHKMKLRSKYFDFIKNGSKKIEVRLNDEKRRGISVGDQITFEELTDENPRYLTVKVVDLYHEKTFNDLLDKFDVSLFADKNATKADLSEVLNEIYSIEEQNKYGVLGIKIEVI